MKKILSPKNLPYAGALVQAVLFSIAGITHFQYMGWAVGLGLGIVVNWSMALSSSRVSGIAKGRKPMAYASLFLLFCLSPVIICSTLGWTLANFSWSIAADLAILLTGSTVGSGLIADAQAKPQVARKPKKVANELPQEDAILQKVARKRVKDDELLAYLAGNAGASQQQVADHFGVTRQAIGPRLKKLYEPKVNV
jgi:hypothetical protein